LNGIVYPVGGAVIGVTVPIAVEFAAKGARIGDPNAGIKISGVVGVGLGVPEIAIAYLMDKRGRTSKETVAFLAAMGGAKLATGASILILDELRKRAAYAFRNRRGSTLPIGPQGQQEAGELERIEFPVVPLVEEI